MQTDIIAASEWTIDSTLEWQQTAAETEGLEWDDGLAIPPGSRARYLSVMRTFPHPYQIQSITFKQSSAWDNWNPVPDIGPQGIRNAPIFLPIADGEYWFFSERRGLRTGYYAWHSSDMQSWTPMGQVSESRWATTAEYANGQIFLYFDEPNDQDPHLIIGENLGGTPTWREIGKVFDDPSDGSDAGAIRTEDGRFHLIYEDWSPINASRNSWDSPLAGHADSFDGITGFDFQEYPPAVDQRTHPTGLFGTYIHRPTSTTEPLTYEIHWPKQDAYGDFTLIQVGERFYLFCDYHPHRQHIRTGYFTSDSIDETFQFGGSFGKGHPDPTIGFAEGQFYLIIQAGNTDYISPGPWVDTVEARVGVDVEGDGEIDQWSNWQIVQEQYARKPGFARIVETIPATLESIDLPAGLGFRFEFRIQDATPNESKPILDQVRLFFAG